MRFTQAISRACLGPCGWHPVLLVCQLHHSVWCRLQTFWRCTWPRYVIDENVKQHRSQYRPLRDTTCHWCPFGYRAIDPYPLAATFQPIPQPLNSPLTKSIFLQYNVAKLSKERLKMPQGSLLAKLLSLVHYTLAPCPYNSILLQFSGLIGPSRGSHTDWG